MDRQHTKETKESYWEAGIALQSPRWEKTWTPQEDLEKRKPMKVERPGMSYTLQQKVTETDEYDIKILALFSSTLSRREKSFQIN